MKSNQSPHFDRLVWQGNPPSNKAREELRARLRVFLGYEGEWASPEASAVPAQRQLVMGNFEDWQAESWPKADGVQTYVGLLYSQLPKSEELLKVFADQEISFFLFEYASLNEVSEMLADLLK